MAKVGIKRAFQLSLIPTIAEIFISLLIQYPTIETVMVDLPNFIFNLGKFAGATYFITLSSTLGLSKYLEEKIEC